MADNENYSKDVWGKSFVCWKILHTAEERAWRAYNELSGNSG
jgi:hypothetical protein